MSTDKYEYCNGANRGPRADTVDLQFTVLYKGSRGRGVYNALGHAQTLVRVPNARKLPSLLPI